MKHIQPDELLEQRKEKERISDENYAKNIQKRKKIAIIIGLALGILGNIIPNISIIAFGGLTLGFVAVMMFMIALTMIWSYIVQFKEIGTLWSIAIYGIGGIILAVSITGAPAFLWWFGLLTAGALISIANEIYRNQSLGI